ncbi:MAG: NfeD family protein [Deltaproteobacteria bacterium]|nr:NfeD family protein [Deltaproteobacteria bacterium]
MAWWIWVGIGLTLVLGELLVPSGFFVLLVGIACIATGGTVAAGFGNPAWLPWLVCGSFIALLFAAVRRPLMQIFGFDTPSAYKEMVNEEIVLSSDIAPGATGQGELRGTVWNVRNLGQTVLRAGQRCKVLRIDGLTVETK